LKCKLERASVNNAERFFSQYIGQRETDGLDFVAELALPIIKNVVSTENVNNVGKNFTSLGRISTEKIKETKEVFAVANAKQNGKNSS
jgi:hypothetical protein